VAGGDTSHGDLQGWYPYHTYQLKDCFQIENQAQLAFNDFPNSGSY